MISYLSFGSIAKLHNNSLLSVSPIGELSNKSRTYAKDPAVFSATPNSTETVLYNFSSLNDNTEFVMEADIANVQISISDWLYEEAKLGNITGDRGLTLNLLQSRFTNQIEITDIGEMVTNNNIWMPSFVTGNHIVAKDKQAFYIWFANDYFATQYPKVSFTIVHPLPLTEIDSLLTLNYQQLAARLALETPDVIEARVHTATQNMAWPFTDRDVDKFQVLDPINTPNYNDAFWRYMEWGNGTDAEDQRYDQIKAEILAVTKHPETEWEEKVPDLFNPLEFYVLPFFDRLGARNQTNGASIRSPIVDTETDMVLVNKYLTPNMSSPHVIKSTQIVPFLYKSTACAFVAKVNNRLGMEKIGTVIPDYQLIPSTDQDLDLMSKTTMEFLLQMENLLAAAESVTPISLVPSGITRITRFGQLYVAKRVGKVKYLVMTRWQYIKDGVIED